MNAQANVAVKAARMAVHDRFRAQIDTFESQVAMLKAKAESAKADAVLRAMAELAMAKRVLDLKVAELTSAGETAFEPLKTDVEARMAAFDQSLRSLAARINAR